MSIKERYNNLDDETKAMVKGAAIIVVLFIAGNIIASFF